MTTAAPPVPRREDIPPYDFPPAPALGSPPARKHPVAAKIVLLLLAALTTVGAAHLALIGGFATFFVGAFTAEADGLANPLVLGLLVVGVVAPVLSTLASIGSGITTVARWRRSSKPAWAVWATLGLLPMLPSLAVIAFFSFANTFATYYG